MSEQTLLEMRDKYIEKLEELIGELKDLVAMQEIYIETLEQKSRKRA